MFTRKLDGTVVYEGPIKPILTMEQISELLYRVGAIDAHISMRAYIVERAELIELVSKEVA